MESILKRYDFMKATEENQDKMVDEIDYIDEEETAKKLGKKGIQDLVKTFGKKVCVTDFPPKSSPGYEMADAAVRSILKVLNEIQDQGTIKEEEAYDVLLDLYVDLLKTGPGSTHGELLSVVAEHNNFDCFLEKLEGDKLMKVIDGLKSIHYIQEKDEENLMVIVEREYINQMEKILGDDLERLQKPVIRKVFLDLYLFFLTQMTKMPVQYQDTLRAAIHKIHNAYDRKPFQDLKDVSLFRNFLQSLEGIICNPGFPQNDKMLREITNTVERVFEIMESDIILDVYADLLQFMKALCLNPNGEKYPKIIVELRKIRDISREHVAKHQNLFDSWAPVAIEILKKGPRREKVGEMLALTAWEFKEHIKPKKSGYDKLWIPIVMGLLSWMQTETVDIVYRIMNEDKWKRMWNWKENIDKAKEILQLLTNADYTDKNGESEDVVEKIADITDCLMEQLIFMKVAHLVEVEITELSMVTLEKSEVEDISMLSRQACLKASLKNNRELIGGYLDRLLVLLMKEGYPWCEGWAEEAVVFFMENMINSLKGSGDTPPDVDEKFTKIFQYCMAEKREFISIETGSFNVYGSISAYSLMVYISLHQEKDSMAKLQPLLPSIQRLMDSKEEELASTMKDVMSLIGTQAAAVLTTEKGVGNMIDLYIKEPSAELLVSVESSYANCPEKLATQIGELIQAFCRDKQTNCNFVMQSLFLKNVAEKQPKIFTLDMMKLIFKHHFMDKTANAQTLLFMEQLSKTRIELLEPFTDSHLVKENLIMQEMSNYHTNILVRIAEKYEKYRQTVYNFFAARMLNSSNEHVLYATVQGLREMLDISGTQIFTKKDRGFVEKLKVKAPSKNVKDVAEDLVNELAGRSLEKVSKDVDGHTENIGKLNIGLAGTKVVVKKVQKDVKKQKKEVEKVKKEFNDVNERVDDVEADVEKVKEKVEELDKKTMSNAPTWSRDVTKLMNPESEHDWRLLASRLGYSPDDIRGWATQSDPCMALLSEWYATHKTIEASKGVLNALQEMNRLDAAAIVENAMKAAEGVVADEPVDYPEPPEVFLSYQWGHQNEVKLINRHLEMAGYKCWMDVGQMGGGDKLFEKIDVGIRAAKIVICCVTEKYAKSPNCNREVNLSVNLGKPMIPLLIEKTAWPPAGSMGPIFSEYLFIRFFQRPGEETKDDRIWPTAKFKELLMQLNCLKVMPDENIIHKRYKDWWIPVVQEIVIPKKDKQNKTTGSIQPDVSNNKKTAASPEVFISYQWGKQKEISALYQRLTGLGFTCWVDIHQMGGGDSLYDKIDRGIRGCKVVVCSVTTKYSLSANCRREVSLADALKKPIIPMLMEKIVWPPSGPMSMVLTQLLYINFSKDESVQKTWKGQQFDELLTKIREYVPEKGIPVSSKATNQNKESKPTAKINPIKHEDPSDPPNLQEKQSPATMSKTEKKTVNQNQNSQDKNSNNHSKPQHKNQSSTDMYQDKHSKPLQQEEERSPDKKWDNYAEPLQLNQNQNLPDKQPSFRSKPSQQNQIEHSPDKQPEQKKASSTCILS